MKKTKLLIILCVFICLIATASCGVLELQIIRPETETAIPEDVLGADWRTTGIVDDYITLDTGDEQLELAVCVGENEIALYYDSEEKRLLAKMEAPGISDAAYGAGNLTSLDYTGDGCDELWLWFTSVKGEQYNYIYTWDSEDGRLESYGMPASSPVLTEIDPYVIKADLKVILTEEDAALFRNVMDAIFSRTEYIRLSNDYDANLRVMMAVRCSPYWTFVDSDEFTERFTAITLTYAYSKAEQEEMRRFIDTEMLTIINSIIRYPNMGELEKVLAVHRYFAEHITYDYEWKEKHDTEGDDFLYKEIGVYQALSTGRGVCHSYAYLCEFALQQLGVECLSIYGTMIDEPDEGHLWLLVRIDGEYYHCDPTWDSESYEGNRLQYFGMTDAERIASGVTISYWTIDSAYGTIVCDDERFVSLREEYEQAE